RCGYSTCGSTARPWRQACRNPDCTLAGQLARVSRRMPRTACTRRWSRAVWRAMASGIVGSAVGAATLADQVATAKCHGANACYNGATCHRRAGYMGLRHYSMGWIALLLLACACTSVPGRSGGEAVAMVVPDGSPQRARLNARVYDDVVARVLRDFRDPDFGGVDFAAEARARRANAIAASDELTLYDKLNRLLGLLDDSHSGATSPTDTARLQAYRENQPPASPGFQSLGMGGELLVTRVHPQGPAARAGVRPGWQWLGAADGREPGLVPAATEGATETLLFRDSAGQRRTLALTAAALPPLARHEAL